MIPMPCVGLGKVFSRLPCYKAAACKCGYRQKPQACRCCFNFGHKDIRGYEALQREPSQMAMSSGAEFVCLGCRHEHHASETCLQGDLRLGTAGGTLIRELGSQRGSIEVS